MEIQRCPECGQRLKTNYCDICMRRVPYTGKKTKVVLDPWEYSSAHREEKGHQCVSFEDKKPKEGIPKTIVKKPKTDSKKVVSVIAIVMGFLSLLPALFGIFESIVEDGFESVPMPEYERSIETQELYNDGEIIITADSLGLYYEEPAIALTVENYTDRTLDVFSNDPSVNGYMIPCGFSAGVEPGETAQAFFMLDSMELERAGITEIAYVELSLSIADWGDWSNVITTDLLRLETPIAWTYNQPVDDSGMELYNDGSVAVRLRSTQMATPGSLDMEVYIENLSGSYAYVYTGKALVNGEEVEGGLCRNLRPDTRAVADGNLLLFLEEPPIEDLSEIREITMELYVDYSKEDGTLVETHSEAITFDLSTIQ